jgi:hypothetical protein
VQWRHRRSTCVFRSCLGHSALIGQLWCRADARPRVFCKSVLKSNVHSTSARRSHLLLAPTASAPMRRCPCRCPSWPAPPQRHQPGHWTAVSLACLGLRPRKLRATGQRRIELNRFAVVFKRSGCSRNLSGRERSPPTREKAIQSP